MNLQKSPNGIEWTRRVLSDGTILPGYTANPVRGCMHGCEWRMPDGKMAKCYAGEVARGVARNAYPNGFEHLQWHPEELLEIKKHKEPCGIFIDSMSDLFGSKVPPEWIETVLDAMQECPQHTFMSLTKNPPNLKGLCFPDNLWVGISAPPTIMFGKELTQSQQYDWLARGLDCLSECNAALKWISIEPLSFDLGAHLIEFGKALNWAVIGAASNGRATFQPDRHDFEMALHAMKGRPVFFKGNLSKQLADEVAGGWRAEFPKL